MKRSLNINAGIKIKIQAAFLSAVLIMPMLIMSIMLIALIFSKPSASFASGNDKSGKYLFNYEHCIDCHSINGVGGTLGPSLTHYGNMHKTLAWTATQIANPSSHFKRGTQVTINGKKYVVLMPGFHRVSSLDLYKIASYLESLK